MLLYRAEAFPLDSEGVVVIGTFKSQLEARKQCNQHATAPLQFRGRQSSLLRAEGSQYVYQILRLEPS